jgi:hypothetical protein
MIHEAPDSPLIAVGLPFRWKLPRPAPDIWRNLDFPSSLRNSATQFIRETLGDRIIIGLHLRNLEGSCSERESGYKEERVGEGMDPQRADRLARIFCDFQPDYLEAVVKSYGYDLNDRERVVLFIASDGQRPELVADYVTRFGAVLPGEWNKSVVFDMVVLSMSRLFVGSPYSTLSRNVKDYRNSRERDENWVFGSEKQVDFP